jgi:hypothetical protein
MKDKISRLGYLKNSPFLKRKSLNIDISDNHTITTDGMAFPIIVDDGRNKSILQPNTGEYFFEANQVKEIPLHLTNIQMKRKYQRGNIVQVPVYNQVQGDTLVSFNTDLSKANPYDPSKIFVKGDDSFFYTLQRKPDGQYDVISRHETDQPAWDAILFSDHNKRKSKMRFREMQEGGFLSLEDYLSGLSEDEQDNFVKQFQNDGLEQIAYKCGGKMKEGKVFIPSTYQVGGLQPNAEIEDGETVLSGSTLKEFTGKTHKEGGIDVYLQGGDIVFSEYLEVPEEVQKAMGLRYKKRSFADISKKYKTDKEEKILSDPNSDKYQINSAELSLANKIAMLNTLFEGQEMSKKTKDNLGTTYQSGGRYDPSTEGQQFYFNHSNISDRFQPQMDGSLYDPETGNFYNRLNDGRYTLKFPVIKDVNGSKGSTNFTPVVTDKYPSMRTAPANPSVYGTVDFLSDWNVETPQTFDGSAPMREHKPNYEYIPQNQPGLPSKPKSQIRKKAEKKVETSNQPTPQPEPLISKDGDFSLLMSDSMMSPDKEVTPNLPSARSQLAVLPTDTPQEIQVKEAKKSWFAKNKDKFGINSKLTGTFLDIGMTLSDSIHVDQPPLYDHQKNPLFNKFYEFDDKESQRVLSQQIRSIQNSNLPEQVKQAQIAEVTANMQNVQAKTDLINAQRYEQKRDVDLNKLQTYIDTNKDVRISDYDNYRQRKAKVNYLRDKFKSEQKERVYNSARDYMDYAMDLEAANEMSPYFKISPITGKVKYKKQPNKELTSDILSQYAQTSNNIDLGNGVSAKQLGNFLIVTDKDGKVHIEKLSDSK